MGLSIDLLTVSTYYFIFQLEKIYMLLVRWAAMFRPQQFVEGDIFWFPNNE